MTGKSNVWPVKASIRPDIVRWLAVIFSPVLVIIITIIIIYIIIVIIIIIIIVVERLAKSFIFVCVIVCFD